jgi:hypothetical protein
MCATFPNDSSSAIKIIEVAFLINCSRDSFGRYTYDNRHPTQSSGIESSSAPRHSPSGVAQNRAVGRHDHL